MLIKLVWSSMSWINQKSIGYAQDHIIDASNVILLYWQVNT